MLALTASCWADPAEVQRRALEALGKLPEHVALEALNTPSDTDVPAASQWTTRVLADASCSTPRVRVEAGDRFWVIAFRRTWSPPCLVAVGKMARGTVPLAADVRLESRALYQNQPYLGNVKELAGQRLRREIRPGELIRPQDLELVPVYEAGASVTVTSPGRGVVLRREAKALEPAFPGRPFRVKTADGQTLSVTIGPDRQVIERSLTP